jgi:hypothetical protein
MARKAAERAAAAVRDIEFDTFLVGCHVPPLISESEEMVWSDLSLSDPEPFKSEVNREVGKAFAAITSIKARSASIEKMNVGDILPSMYVYAQDGTIQHFSVPTNPQSTSRELVLAPQDEMELGTNAWVCLNDPPPARSMESSSAPQRE